MEKLNDFLERKKLMDQKVHVIKDFEKAHCVFYDSISSLVSLDK